MRDLNSLRLELVKNGNMGAKTTHGLAGKANVYNPKTRKFKEKKVFQAFGSQEGYVKIDSVEDGIAFIMSEDTKLTQGTIQEGFGPLATKVKTDATRDEQANLFRLACVDNGLLQEEEEGQEEETPSVETPSVKQEETPNAQQTTETPSVETPSVNERDAVIDAASNGKKRRKGQSA